MDRKELEAEGPLKVGDTTLIPLTEVRSFSAVRGEGAAFAFRKMATGVVAIGPWGALALDIEGEEVSLEELMAEVAGLKELLAGFRGSEVGDKG